MWRVVMRSTRSPTASSGVVASDELLHLILAGALFNKTSRTGNISQSRIGIHHFLIWNISWENYRLIGFIILAFSVVAKAFHISIFA